MGDISPIWIVHKFTLTTLYYSKHKLNFVITHRFFSLSWESWITFQLLTLNLYKICCVFKFQYVNYSCSHTYQCWTYYKYSHEKGIKYNSSIRWFLYCQLRHILRFYLNSTSMPQYKFLFIKYDRCISIILFPMASLIQTLNL